MLDKDIKVLIKVLEESKIDELEVSTFWGKQKIRLRKSLDKNDQDNKQKINEIEIDNKSSESLPTEDLEANKPNVSESEINRNTVKIKAPLVGTVYLSPKPELPPFIKEGDTFNKGDIICIIEAMKIFNEIESDVSGKVIKILSEDASPVEYDQDLFIIASN